MTIPIPPDEDRRLEVLRSYGILDTPPEEAFDDIARLASHVCRAPIALVTLIDKDREWFKARVGVNLTEASREGFCAHTIMARELMVVNDALQDPRFAENEYVTGPPHVRFYAGAPLITPEGPVIGTLCVIDTAPRPFDEGDRQALLRLARTVQTQLELRRALHGARESAERSLSHQQALIELARTCLETADVDESLRRLVRKVSETLRAERVNFWRLTPERRAIRCAAHYQATGRAFSSGMEIAAETAPRYFEALLRGEVIPAHDARTDPRTNEFHQGYLVPLGIGALLDAPVFIGGAVGGVLCTEHVGPPRTWTREEQVFAVGVANLVTLVVEQGEKRKVEQALSRSEEKRLLAEEAARGRHSFERLVGKSAAMQEVYRKLRLAAQSDVTVLVTGESGTGKELAASAIHSISERKNKPFIAVNCSAIPEALLESELFGHVKGSFTGAVRDKVGLFQAADGGTLFLDEIGDMSPALQVKVLRALQEKEVRRVGDEKVSKVDVRIVGATNRDLQKMVAAGKIREDFYYRIKVFEIVMPPLRERREDVPVLVDHFLGRMGRRGVNGIDGEALRALMNHPWPGNVRELENAVEYALVTASGSKIEGSHLPASIGNASVGEALDPEAYAERERVLAALEQSGWNRTKAAVLLGTSRVTVWKKMRRFGIQPN